MLFRLVERSTGITVYKGVDGAQLLQIKNKITKSKVPLFFWISIVVADAGVGGRVREHPSRFQTARSQTQRWWKTGMGSVANPCLSNRVSPSTSIGRICITCPELVAAKVT